ncbi:MAG: metallophosphoesterase family protein [Elusimicrobiales bacterium]|nr:metallophosphoesterase family protein [Elusimicrobiales bacterium]
MRYGIFSDIHGNLEAFKSVLDFYRKQGIKKLFCCGDIVGYGPNPQECVKLAMGIKDLYTVLGNHDAAVVGKMKTKWFNDAAMEAIEFTRARLTGESVEYLRSRPLRIDTNDFTIVHGSPSKPLQEYLISEMQFLSNMRYWTVSPCFVGHTHIPCHFSCGNNGFPYVDFMKTVTKFKIEASSVLINPGAVGQPRDGNPLASCGIYDSSSKVFELVRIPYDIKVTQQKMRHNNMPGLLVERLGMGL